MKNIISNLFALETYYFAVYSLPILQTFKNEPGNE